jgi:hypothetical protein
MYVLLGVGGGGGIKNYSIRDGTPGWKVAL